MWKKAWLLPRFWAEVCTLLGWFNTSPEKFCTFPENSCNCSWQKSHDSCVNAMNLKSEKWRGPNYCASPETSPTSCSFFTNILPVGLQWAEDLMCRELGVNCTLNVCVISHYSFLDKIYCLSSSEALAKFIRNPRSYIMEPYPCPPCKICVVGPPCSGKTTLAKNLAQRYQAQVI